MDNAVYFLIAGLNEKASQAKCPGYGMYKLLIRLNCDI